MNATMGLAGLMLLLGACAYSGDGNVASATETPTTEAPTTETGIAPASDSVGADAPGPAKIDESVAQLRSELTRLQAQVSEQTGELEELRARSVENAEIYRNLVASIDTKLQAGAAPGDPALVELWSQAEAQLDLIDDDLARIDALSSGIAESASRAADLQNRLRMLADETGETALSIDRLQTELVQSSARQSNYLGIERSNLQALALAIDTGEPADIALANAIDTTATPSGAPGTGIATGRPLVVIRFDTEEVDYEPALFSAVSAALDRRPAAGFDVAAVSPAAGTEAQMAASVDAARRHADAVLRSLASMGLTEDRVSVISVVSPEVQVNEVHVFVR